MTTVRILNCIAGKCTAIGEIDLPDGARIVTARSPDGDFSMEVVPHYVSSHVGSSAVEFAISFNILGKSIADLARVVGFRLAQAQLGPR